MGIVNVYKRDPLGERDINRKYSDSAWKDSLKKGVIFPGEQLEKIRASFSAENMLGDIKQQLNENPEMPVEKVIRKVVNSVLEEIPNEYYADKDHVRSIQNSLLEILRKRGEKAFVNIIENGKYEDAFELQDEKELKDLHKKMQEKVFESNKNTENNTNYKYGDKYKEQHDSKQQRKRISRWNAAVEGKNLTSGDRDVASKIRDKAYTTERQRKDQERRYF